MSLLDEAEKAKKAKEAQIRATALEILKQSAYGLTKPVEGKIEKITGKPVGELVKPAPQGGVVGGEAKG